MDKNEILNKVKDIVTPYCKNQEALTNLTDGSRFLEDLEINPEDLFGRAESLEKSAEVLETPTIVQKAIAAKNVVYLHSTKNVTEDLKELAVHYEADETIEVPKETLIESINKVGDKELIGEEEITAFIKTPKLSTDSKS